jgi:hypothetical protein
MTYYALITCCLMACVMLPGGTAPKVAFVAQPTPAIQFHLPDRLTLREPVVFDFAVINDLAEPISVDMGWNRIGHFAFDVRKPDGLVVSARPEPRGGVSRLSRVTVDARQRYEHWLVLNEWLTFDQIGTYQLTIRFSGTLTNSAGRRISVNPMSHSFEVFDRDEQALRNRCAALVREAIHSDGLPEEQRAATALSFVEDPVAIPYLAELVNNDRSLQTALDGLLRIGGPLARKIVEQVAADVNPAKAILGKAALARIKN